MMRRFILAFAAIYAVGALAVEVPVAKETPKTRVTKPQKTKKVAKALEQKAPIIKDPIKVTAQKSFIIKLDDPMSGSTGYVWYVTSEPANPFFSLASVTGKGSTFTFNVKQAAPQGGMFRLYVMFSLVGPGKKPSDADEVVIFPVEFGTDSAKTVPAAKAQKRPIRERKRVRSPETHEVAK